MRHWLRRKFEQMREHCRSIGLSKRLEKLLEPLSEHEQAEDLHVLERGILEREIVETHGPALASRFAENLALFTRANQIDVATLLPLEVGIKSGENGSVQAVVHGTQSKRPRFLKEHWVVAIRCGGNVIGRPTEVLRIIHGARTGKDVYGSNSPHRVAMQPENVRRMREMGFIAVLGDGTERSLADLYECNS